LIISKKKNPLAVLEEIGGKYIIDYEEIVFPSLLIIYPHSYFLFISKYKKEKYL